MFGNIGLPEMMLIMAIALIVFGPKKLPEIGRSIGKAIREFKKSTEEIKDRFEEQIKMDDLKDIRSDFKDIKSNLSDISPLKGFQDGLNDIKSNLDDLNPLKGLKDGVKDIQKDLSGEPETKKSPDEMTFLEHLEDLRKRLVWSLGRRLRRRHPGLHLRQATSTRFLSQPLTQYLPEGIKLAFTG